MSFFRSLLHTLTAFVLGVSLACGISPAVADIVQNTIYNLGSTVVIASDGSSTSYFRWAKDIWFYAQTADGADNGTINITGGGGVASAGRGGGIIIRGNEASNGALTLYSGANGGNIIFAPSLTNVATVTSAGIIPSTDGDNSTANLGSGSFGFKNIYLSDATNRSSLVQSNGLYIAGPSGQSILFRNGSTDVWSISSAGVLTQNATNGGNLVFQRSSTGIQVTAGAGLTAAGTTISDALQLSATYNDVTTAAAGTGVKLWSNTSGHIIVVKNRGANALLVYPQNGSAAIDGNAAGAAVSVAVGSSGIFFQISANQWVSLEAAAA